MQIIAVKNGEASVWEVSVAAAAEEELLKCYTFSDEAPVRPPFIRGVVT